MAASGCWEGTMLWPQLEESRSQVWLFFVSRLQWHGSAPHWTWLWRNSESAVYQTECLDWLMICCGMTIERSGPTATSGRNKKALILKIYKQLRWSECHWLAKVDNNDMFYRYKINWNFSFMTDIFVQALPLIHRYIYFSLTVVLYLGVV